MVFPAYEDYCFANVPGTVGEAFGVDLGRPLPTGAVNTDGVDHVVLVLIDGLGLRRFRRDGPEVSFLQRLVDAGRVTPLTSVVPSETSAAIATVHTGRPPADHGLLGGRLYLQEAGFVVESLSFSRRGGPPESAGEGPNGLGPSVLNDGPTVHERLARAGVESHVVQPAATLGTSYSEAVLAGSSRHGYDDAAEAGRSIQTVFAQATEPTYLYCYLPHVDALSHRHGPDAEEYREGLATACEGVEQGLDAAVSEGQIDPERTLVLAVADHGHVPASPAVFTDLTADPVVRESLQQEDGEPIRPTGGPRSAFLHLRADRIDRVRTHLTEQFDGHVFDRETALDELALFGPEPSDRARRRCGDLVCVPREGAAWFGESMAEKRSLHGGLAPEEMLVPCASARLSEI